MLSDLGCDLERTYFDVPRLRTMAHGEFMKVGLALQFHPHRDTWFSAPYAQLNWWLPVYEIESDNSMAFHPRYFDVPVENSSSIYDYDVWTRTGRQQAAQQVKKETRAARAAEDLELDPQVRVVTPVGGVLLFSAAQLHSTVPNTTERTRFSIDFRTVNLDDLLDDRAAPTSTRPARARRSATSSARATSSHCRRTSSSATASLRQAPPDRRRVPIPRDRPPQPLLEGCVGAPPERSRGDLGVDLDCCSSGLTGTRPNAGAPAPGR